MSKKELRPHCNPVVIVVYDLYWRQWCSYFRTYMSDLRMNGNLKSLVFPWQSPAQFSQIEQDALKLAQEMTAEFWAVSSLTGERTSGCNKWAHTLIGGTVEDVGTEERSGLKMCSFQILRFHFIYRKLVKQSHVSLRQLYVSVVEIQ